MIGSRLLIPPLFTSHHTRFIIKLLLTLCVPFTCCSIRLYAQANESGESIEVQFDRLIGIENSGIINGRQYRMEFLGAGTHPFFGTGESNGSVEYDGNKHFVPLMYDIFKDEVIVKHLTSSGLGWFVQLDKTRIQQFVLSGHLFRNFSRGFHEVMFEDGDLMIVAKRSKLWKSEKGVFNYQENHRFFLIDAGQWRPFAGTSSLLQLLETNEEKKALRQFINENRIKVRKFRHDDLLKLGTFLNTLRQRHQP